MISAELPQVAQQGADEYSQASQDETPNDASNHAASSVLGGWRLYTVQLRYANIFNSSSGWSLLTQYSLCLALFLGGIDSSIVATALVTIGRDFNDLVQLQWVVLAYLLTYLGTKQKIIYHIHSTTDSLAGFALIFSRISDVIGRKWTSIAVR